MKRLLAIATIGFGLAACGGSGSDNNESSNETAKTPAEQPAKVNNLSDDNDLANVVADIGDLWKLKVNEDSVTLSVIDTVYEVVLSQTFTIDSTDAIEDRTTYSLSQVYDGPNDSAKTANGTLTVYEDGRWTYSGEVVRSEGRSIATTAQGSGSVANDLNDLVGVYNLINVASKTTSGLTYKEYDPKKVVVDDDAEKGSFFLPLQLKFVADTEFKIQPAIKELLCFDGDINPDATSVEDACQDGQREESSDAYKLFKSQTDDGVIDLFFDGITKEGQTEARLVLSSFDDELNSFTADEVGLNDNCTPEQQNGSEDTVCDVLIGKQYFVRVKTVDNSIFPQGAKYSCSASGITYGEVEITDASTLLFKADTGMSDELRGTMIGEFEGDDGSTDSSVDNRGKFGKYTITYNEVPNGDYESRENGRYTISDDRTERTGGVTFTKDFTPAPSDDAEPYNEETRLYVLPVNKELFYLQAPVDRERMDSEFGFNFRIDAQTALICERQ